MIFGVMKVSKLKSNRAARNPLAEAATALPWLGGAGVHGCPDRCVRRGWRGRGALLLVVVAGVRRPRCLPGRLAAVAGGATGAGIAVLRRWPVLGGLAVRPGLGGLAEGVVDAPGLVVVTLLTASPVAGWRLVLRVLVAHRLGPFLGSHAVTVAHRRVEVTGWVGTNRRRRRGSVSLGASGWGSDGVSCPGRGVVAGSGRRRACGGGRGGGTNRRRRWGRCRWGRRGGGATACRAQNPVAGAGRSGVGEASARSGVGEASGRTLGSSP